MTVAGENQSSHRKRVENTLGGSEAQEIQPDNSVSAYVTLSHLNSSHEQEETCHDLTL